MLRIGQVAKESGVGVETVRFYESEGLIAPPRRSASGYRQFPAAIIEQIRFIQNAKKLGFSLKEVGELIELRGTPGARCDRIRISASAKIAEIQAKIDTLVQIKSALEPLVDQCNSNDPIGDCPILNSLDETAATR